MRMICLTLLFHCFVSFTLAQSFEITRKRNGRDSFNIPAPMCNRSGANSGRGCKTFYAVDGVRKCSCSCPTRNATFTFLNKQWLCLENRQARNHFYRGCSFTASFSRERSDRRLPTLATGNQRAISVQYVFGLWQLWRCSLDIRSSWYMGCWGTRHRLSQYYNTAVKLFTIRRRNPSAGYFLQVNKNVRGTNIFKGKIVNLVVECRLFWGRSTIRNCLLFKLPGKTTCPVTKPTIPSSSTMRPLKTSFSLLSTSRITSSRVSTKTTTFQQSSSITMVSMTSSCSLTTPFTTMETTSKISIFKTTVSEVFTYFKTQSIVSEVLPTALASQPNVSEALRTVSSVFGVSPTTFVNRATISETSPRAQTIQSTISELSPTASVSQSTDFGISPATFATQHIASESSPKERTLQPTNSKILLEASTFHSDVSAISPTPSLLQSVASEIPLERPETQPTISDMSPAALDSRERTLTEPDSEGFHTHIKGILPSSAPATQPTVSETLPTEPVAPPTDPETAQTLAELYPKTINTEPSTVLSNAPPSISHDREENRGRDDTSSLGLIAGVVAAVVISAAIAVFIAYRRHYINERPRSNSIGTVSEMTTETIVMSLQTKKTYEPNIERKNNNTSEHKEKPLRGSTSEIPAWLADASHSHVNTSLEDDDSASHLYSPLEIPQPHRENNRESVYQVLEKPALVEKASVGQVSSDDRLGTKIHCDKSEPFYYVLEGPYPEDAERPGQCRTISPEEPVYSTPEEPIYSTPEEPVYSTLNEVCPDLSSGSDCDPKCNNDLEYNVLERRYFEGSKVPDHYVFVTPNGQVLNRLEIPCAADSSARINNDPECADLAVRNVLEERYFKGSEIADHYAHISAGNTLDNMIVRLGSNSSKIASLGSRCTNEPLEERFFESSEVPSHYLNVLKNGQLFSTLEALRSNPNSLTRSHCAPECLDEPECCTCMERYLEDSNGHDRYVAMISPGEPVDSTEDIDRNTSKLADFDEKHDANHDQIVKFRRRSLTRIPLKPIARKQPELSTESKI